MKNYWKGNKIKRDKKDLERPVLSEFLYLGLLLFTQQTSPLKHS